MVFPSTVNQTGTTQCRFRLQQCISRPPGEGPWRKREPHPLYIASSLPPLLHSSSSITITYSSISCGHNTHIYHHYRSHGSSSFHQDQAPNSRGVRATIRIVSALHSAATILATLPCTIEALRSRLTRGTKGSSTMSSLLLSMESPLKW